jgi:hypothetical protein
MKQPYSLLLGSIAFAAAMLQLSPAMAERCCFRCDPCRGCAIMSPIESPDACPSPVGGAYRYTPYYCGYGIDRRCLPPAYGTVDSHGLSAPAGSTGALGRRTVPYGHATYGSFTGASNDESRMLHLGGYSPSGAGSRPNHGGGDIIDRIEGHR